MRTPRTDASPAIVALKPAGVAPPLLIAARGANRVTALAAVLPRSLLRIRHRPIPV